ncbi:MAG: prepilin-type N-terminal cleavage/methylation domain-containing protein [Candidatus Omnitrophica bacterium]|nr:prepilin-type N-terminal cleavage/methylation domain-containing protein [Candidatus Omnitrophota bacterium]
MRRGFTLLELIIVIIIIGVLATLGFTQYTKMVEKGRAGEARALLGTLRTAERAYSLEYGAYTATIANMGVEAPVGCAQATHYFSYACAATGTCTATRCTAGGKPPVSTVAYVLVLSQDGSWTGSTPGY